MKTILIIFLSIDTAFIAAWLYFACGVFDKGPEVVDE